MSAGPVEVMAWPSGRARVRIRPGAAWAASEEVERAWAARRALNPRLHDGPVTAVVGVDADRGEVACERSSYKRFVAEGGVEALGVTGVCVRSGGGGDEVLVARRGAGVRIYAGMWETAPRGGLEADGLEELGLAELAACLAVEGREELGPGLALRPGAVVAAVRDRAASSLDLCLRCEASDVEGAGAAGSWEYAEHRWIDAAELARWASTGRAPAGMRGVLSPPCAALASWSGFSGCVRTRPSTP